MRRTSLSRFNDVDAGDDLGEPLTPFLAILHVRPCGFYRFRLNGLVLVTNLAQL
jgi:hypothetical protein